MACNKVLRLEEKMKAQEQFNKDKDQRTKELEQQVQAQKQLNIFQARCLQLQKGTRFFSLMIK